MSLELERVDVSYGHIRAVREVSLTVGDGEFVCVLGRNGAGKSSLLRAIAGFNRPSSGRILWDGKEITRLAPHRRVRLGIAFAMDGRRIFRTASVIDNLRLGGYIYRHSRTRLAAGIERMTDLFPVLARKSQLAAGTLSGGEQQMLVIAQALMAEPQLVLLDEPSAGLAPLLVADMFAALAKLRQQGVHLLLIEQFVRPALALSDRGYVLDNGEIVLSGSSDELLTSETVADIYIGRATPT